MRSRLQSLCSSRAICARSKVPDVSAYRTPLCLRLQQRRSITADEKPLPESDSQKGPNQDQLGHVSEEAATTGKITGEGGPDLDQSTPVQDVHHPLATTMKRYELTKSNIDTEAR